MSYNPDNYGIVYNQGQKADTQEIPIVWHIMIMITHRSQIIFEQLPINLHPYQLGVMILS